MKAIDLGAMSRLCLTPIVNIYFLKLLQSKLKCIIMNAPSFSNFKTRTYIFSICFRILFHMTSIQFRFRIFAFAILHSVHLSSSRFAFLILISAIYSIQYLNSFQFKIPLKINSNSTILTVRFDFIIIPN